MNLPDLKHLYNILHWHKFLRKEPIGKSVGIYLPIPTHISSQFPVIGRKSEDDSPQHVTIVYIGDFCCDLEDKLINVISSIVREFKPFRVKLSKPDKFINDKGQIILHSPIKSKKLRQLHYMLRSGLMKNQIPINVKYATYNPHSTIAYLNSENETKQYRDICPEGDFMVDCIWIWGTKEPYMIPLGR